MMITSAFDALRSRDPHVFFGFPKANVVDTILPVLDDKGPAPIAWLYRLKRNQYWSDWFVCDRGTCDDIKRSGRKGRYMAEVKEVYAK